MNVDYNKHNIVKYLANNKDKDIWKMSVSSICLLYTSDAADE